MIWRLVEIFPPAWRARLDAAALLVLRVVFGGAMIYGHGWGKLTTYGERSASFPDPLGVGSPASLGLAVFAEAFCALAIVLGLLTRLAALPLIVTMLVAFFVVHGNDPFGDKELALVYLAAYLALFLRGAGAWSVDAWLKNLGSKAAPSDSTRNQP